MTRAEMDKAAEWLREQADAIAQEEPVDQFSIAAFRAVADEFDLSIAEDER